MRLLKARAVKRDGAVVAAGTDLIAAEGFTLSIGPTRYYRIEVVSGEI